MKHTVVIFTLFAMAAHVTAAASADGQGEQIFKQKCAMCHIVNGKGGAIGPELTKIAAKLKAKEIRMQLENPKKSNPSTSMPSFKTLPKDEMDALLGYLKTLK